MYKPSVKTVEAGILSLISSFYKIGEVSRITDIEPYVLRYWRLNFRFKTEKE